jgi:hypothetical protein
MFNDRLSTEAARERINQRLQEVETYSLQKRLGYGDRGGLKLLFAAAILTVVVGALLF